MKFDREGYFSVNLPSETAESRSYFRIEHEEYLVVTKRPTTKPVDEPDYPGKGVTYLFVKRYDPPVLHEHPRDVARRAAGK